MYPAELPPSFQKPADKGERLEGDLRVVAANKNEYKMADEPAAVPKAVEPRPAPSLPRGDESTSTPQSAASSMFFEASDTSAAAGMTDDVVRSTELEQGPEDVAEGMLPTVQEEEESSSEGRDAVDLLDRDLRSSSTTPTPLAAGSPGRAAEALRPADVSDQPPPPQPRPRPDFAHDDGDAAQSVVSSLTGLSVLTTSTNDSGSSSGSGSTITQASYSRPPQDAERGGSSGRPRRSPSSSRRQQQLQHLQHLQQQLQQHPRPPPPPPDALKYLDPDSSAEVTTERIRRSMDEAEAEAAMRWGAGGDKARHSPTAGSSDGSSSSSSSFRSDVDEGGLLPTRGGGSGVRGGGHDTDRSTSPEREDEALYYHGKGKERAVAGINNPRHQYHRHLARHDARPASSSSSPVTPAPLMLRAMSPHASSQAATATNAQQLSSQPPQQQQQQQQQQQPSQQQYQPPAHPRSYGTPEMPRGPANHPHLPPSTLLLPQQLARGGLVRPRDHSQHAKHLPRAEKLPLTGYELLASRLSSGAGGEAAEHGEESASSRAGGDASPPSGVFANGYATASGTSSTAGTNATNTSTTATTPPLKPIYRRFEALNHRLLLHLQDELCELEEQLRRLDTADTQTRRLQDRILPASRRADFMGGGELQWHRTDVLGKIGFKLGQYNHVLSSFTSTSHLPSPRPQDVSAYRSYLTGSSPIADVETRFLDVPDDLVSLAVADEPSPSESKRRARGKHHSKHAGSQQPAAGGSAVGGQDGGIPPLRRTTPPPPQHWFDDEDDDAPTPMPLHHRRRLRYAMRGGRAEGRDDKDDPFLPASSSSSGSSGGTSGGSGGPSFGEFPASAGAAGDSDESSPLGRRGRTGRGGSDGANGSKAGSNGARRQPHAQNGSSVSATTKEATKPQTATTTWASRVLPLSLGRQRPRLTVGAVAAALCVPLALFASAAAPPDDLRFRLLVVAVTGGGVASSLRIVNWWDGEEEGEEEKEGGEEEGGGGEVEAEGEWARRRAGNKASAQRANVYSHWVVPLAVYLAAMAVAAALCP